MNRALAERVRTALCDPHLRAFDPAAVDRLDAAFAHADQMAGLVVESPHGGTLCFLPARGAAPKRRFLELDRTGALVAALKWNDRGALTSAVVRSAHDDWIGVETRATWHATWGCSDRLWRLPEGPTWRSAVPLTVFEALDWASISHIPPLAEPARLPSGAGTAVLNLIAALAADQRVSRLRYRGPYATEQLFTALLESFHFAADAADPLRRFFEGTLDWTPAPHERHFPSAGLCIQLRAGVEKVVLHGRAYYRAEWRSVKRHAPRRVHDAGGVVRCSLWALGAAVEDHLILDRRGTVRATPVPAPDPRSAAPMSPPILAGLEALIRAASAPALDSHIQDAAAALAIEWGGVTGDLIEIAGPRARLSWRLADAGAARIRSAASPAERLGRALELLTEMALLLGDAVRARTQSALAAAPLDVQQAALRRKTPAPDVAAAIATAAAALAEDMISRR